MIHALCSRCVWWWRLSCQKICEVNIRASSNLLNIFKNEAVSAAEMGKILRWKNFVFDYFEEFCCSFELSGYDFNLERIFFSSFWQMVQFLVKKVKFRIFSSGVQIFYTKKSLGEVFVFLT